MIGRTNALVHPMVSSVNGKTGIVTLTPEDIAYDPNATYTEGSVGYELDKVNDIITFAQIDAMYTASAATLTMMRSAPTPGDEIILPEEENETTQSTANENDNNGEETAGESAQESEEVKS